jgi:hypothetical protein
MQQTLFAKNKFGKKSVAAIGAKPLPVVKFSITARHLIHLEKF